MVPPGSNDGVALSLDKCNAAAASSIIDHRIVAAKISRPTKIRVFKRPESRRIHIQYVQYVLHTSSQSTYSQLTALLNAR
jgi:hypothetical protein